MKTILFFISSTRHSCQNRLEGICRYAKGKDWHVQVVERAFHKVNVQQLLDFWKPIGVIAECGSGADELKADAFGNLPVVFFDADRSSRGPGFYIGSDARDIAGLAARHLLALKLPHFAYASFRIPIFWSRERGVAFAAALKQAGFACLQLETVKELEPINRQKAIRRFVASLPRPCGIFAANDLVAEEVLNACAQQGVSVPDEVAILGVDNDEAICENANPSISSIAVDFEAGGYQAAELLDELMMKPRSRSKTCIFPAVRVVTRQSTRRVACDPSRVAAALEFIRRHACAGIGVKDVVTEMGVPRRTAELHFRSATGRSILEEIDDVRFAKVFDLLRNPRQQLDAIPDLCGFSTGVALRKAFRLRTGMSMRDWRKRTD